MSKHVANADIKILGNIKPNTLTGKSIWKWKIAYS
jgi:hypothetical protein